MKRFSTKKRIVAAGLTVGLTLGIAGAAFAFFTSSGTGTGSGVVGTSTNWTVASTASSGGPLFPGSGSEAIPFTVTNASAGQQAINSIATALTTDNSGGVFDTTSGVFVDGCLASWFTVSNTVPSFPYDLAGTNPGAAGVYSGTATLTMQDAPTVAQDACQGLTPQIKITVG